MTARKKPAGKKSTKKRTNCTITDGTVEGGQEYLTLGARAEVLLVPDLCGRTLIQGAYHTLPQKPDAPFLLALVHSQPGIYSTMIGCLMLGQSIRSAAQTIGLSLRVIATWMRIGTDDLCEGRDSYYSRLAQDITRACASAAGQMEICAAAKDPIAWLTRGPGRSVFRDTPYWQLDKPGQQQDQEYIDDPLDPLPVLTADTSPTDDGTINTADHQLSQAVDVLTAMGIAQNPAMATAMQEQHRLTTINQRVRDIPTGTPPANPMDTRR